VGYRFSVLQRIAPSDDFEFAFKSRVLKLKASQSQAAAYPWRSWQVPLDLVPSDFRVLIDLIYYRKGSTTEVRGKVRGVMEVHRHGHPSEPSFVIGSPGDGGECIYNFHT
jgi:hypothetical protein